MANLVREPVSQPKSMPSERVRHVFRSWFDTSPRRENQTLTEYLSGCPEAYPPSAAPEAARASKDEEIGIPRYRAAFLSLFVLLAILLSGGCGEKIEPGETTQP